MIEDGHRLEPANPVDPGIEDELQERKQALESAREKVSFMIDEKCNLVVHFTIRTSVKFSHHRLPHIYKNTLNGEREKKYSLKKK